MTVLRVPFHQDTRLPDTDAPLPDDIRALLVDPVLPDADEQWPRLVALEDAVAEAVRQALVASGSGDASRLGDASQPGGDTGTSSRRPSRRVRSCCTSTSTSWTAPS